MTENENNTSGGLPSLEQVVSQIDKSLLNIDDSQALRLGLAAIAGAGPQSKGERYILFSIGETFLAVSITGVVEVVDLPSITRLPNVPPWVQGIANVRGEIISVVDFPLFMKWSEIATAKGASLIILGEGKIKTGIRIDKVLGTINRDTDEEISAQQQEPSGEISEIFPIVDDRDFRTINHKALLHNDRFINLTDLR